jgi:hypothetical protein
MITAEISLGSARYAEMQIVPLWEQLVDQRGVFMSTIERMQKNMEEVLNEFDWGAPVNYDLEQMQHSLGSGTVRVPLGLTREQRRAYLKLQADQREIGAEYENILLNNLDSLYEE